MTSPTIDNSATKDLKRTITWQFDKAEKLVGTVGMLDDFFNAAVKEPWDDFADGIDITESADAHSLTVWGKLLGVPRPTVAVSQSTARAICDEAYRRILVARFRLLNSSGTTKDYLDFLKYVFEGNVKISHADDMALEFEYDENEIPGDTDSYQYDLYLLFGQNPDAIFEYPAGVKSRVQSTGPVVAFEEQVTMVKNGAIVSKSEDVVNVDLTIKNTAEAVIDRVTVEVEVVNRKNDEVQIKVGSYISFYIDYDDRKFIADTQVPITIRSGESAIMTFTRQGDLFPESFTSLVYAPNNDSYGASVVAFVQSYTGHEVDPTEITIPEGSYFTEDGIDYSCDREITLQPQESSPLTFSAYTTTVPSFATTTLYDNEGNAIGNVTATFGSAEHIMAYPDGSSPAVLTAARVVATLTGDSAIIPAGAKTTIGDIGFFTPAAALLTPEDNSFVMVAFGNHPVGAGAITDVTDSEGGAISGVSAFTNPRRSTVDFEIETLDNGTIAWRRDNP